eukprot:6195386-Pleurochrysis_carterae.AAC.1
MNKTVELDPENRSMTAENRSMAAENRSMAAGRELAQSKRRWERAATTRGVPCGQRASQTELARRMHVAVEATASFESMLER